MELNADFTQRVSVHAEDIPWKASPMPGVDRRMLDRIGDEVARATTIVRYAPGSSFSSHVHTGGEEFLVLEGVFQDEHGDFPAGSYIRNPPESSHTPASEPGTTIFVKLWQFDMADRTHVRIDTNKARYVADPERSGVSVLPLFHDDREDVVMEVWEAGAIVPIAATSGAEVLVVSGGFDLDGEAFSTQSWLRVPKGDSVSVKVGVEGAKVWIKRDHMMETPQPPAA
ncbi:MAG: cupin domain-containing protein [Pseudomonadota bacterium]